MLLRKVALRSFCGFKEFALAVGDFSVLVGPNNGGKTTVLRAIKFAMDAFREYFGGNLRPLDMCPSLSERFLALNG